MNQEWTQKIKSGFALILYSLFSILLLVYRISSQKRKAVGTASKSYAYPIRDRVALFLKPTAASTASLLYFSPGRAYKTASPASVKDILNYAEKSCNSYSQPLAMRACLAASRWDSCLEAPSPSAIFSSPR